MTTRNFAVGDIEDQRGRQQRQRQIDAPIVRRRQIAHGDENRRHSGGAVGERNQIRQLIGPEH
jgi:hypothetical protein